MVQALKEKTTVQAGGTIHLEIPGLTPGTPVEVVVYIESNSTPKKNSLANRVGSAKGGFYSPEAVDGFLSQERGAWED
ncbi:MAG: hypothetical protein KA419_09240 [Acidobacteria bacterium]|nr:hypothetical protein [Acidobacteriota bacterium]